MVAEDTHRPRTSLLIVTFTDVVEVGEFLLTVKELVEVTERAIFKESLVKEFWTHALVSPLVNLSQIVYTI